MAALMDADPDQAAVISAPVLCSPAAVAMGHSYHMGPPSLRSSVPWGLQLLHEADATHPALHAARDALEALQSRSEMVVSVDWDGVTLEQLPGVVELAVRRAGVQVAASEGRAGSPLSVSFSVRDAAAGEVYVAQLRWEGGSRHLHCLAPLLAPLRLDGLTAVPADGPPPGAGSLTGPRLGAPPLAYLPDRGVGVELELITLAAETGRGCFTKAHLTLTLTLTQTLTLTLTLTLALALSDRWMGDRWMGDGWMHGCMDRRMGSHGTVMRSSLCVARATSTPAHTTSVLGGGALLAGGGHAARRRAR